MAEISQEAERAKNILLLMFGIFLLIEGITIIIILPDLIDIIRITLTISLMWCVIRGFKWAIWLTITLWSITALLAVFIGIYFLFSKVLFGSILIVVGVIISITPIYMLGSKNLQKYFKEKRLIYNLDRTNIQK